MATDGKRKLYFWRNPLRVFVLLILMVAAGCTSRDGDLNLFSVEEDLELGKSFSRQIADTPGEYPVLDEAENARLYAAVRGIVQKVLNSPAVLHRDDFGWEVRIIKDDSICNAFCTPGGYIYVYTGLIRALESEDELAGVLGHEIAHADLRHSTEQMTKEYGLKIILQLVLGEGDFLGSVIGNLLGLRFSRSDESEADRMSVRYLSDTGYDPRGVAYFFEKLQARGETAGALVFLNTHPNPENRLEEIQREWQALGAKTVERNKDSYRRIQALLP